ncbi:MAG: HAD hydrolase-like protein [Anaerolineales bacterium]|nr:HAD hydrolase-like protein [Anaerolineales bacterium]
MLDIIAFDADDTLWHTEYLYSGAQEEFRTLLAPYADTAELDAQLYATEMRNLGVFGYGVKGFTLSMIETAIQLTDGRIDGRAIQRIVELAKDMLRADVRLLDHAADTIQRLAQDHALMIITKGDLFDQETKVARSGLGAHFQHVEVVSDKTRESYTGLLARHGLAPERFLMVGNSLRSDVLPVLALGAHAVYVPYHITWAHELVAEAEQPRGGFEQIEHLGQLPDVVARLEARGGQP